MEYINFNNRSADIVFQGLSKHMELSLVQKPSEQCEVLFVPLVGQQSVDFLERTVLPENCFTIFLVFHLTGAVVPFLKLADYTIFLGPKQQDIIEKVLEVTYPGESLPFPGEKEVLPLKRPNSFVYLPNEFNEALVPFVEECVGLSKAWYKPEDDNGTIHILCRVSEDKRALFDELKKRILSEKFDAPIQFHVEGDLMVEEIVDLIKTSSMGDCFTQEQSNEQIANLIKQQHPSLLYMPMESNWILEEMARYELTFVHDYDGLLRSILMDKHRPVSMVEFYIKVEHLISEVKPQVEEARREKRAATEVDTLGTLQILHGEPLSNSYIFSICFRNQKDKIIRAIDSILAQEGCIDYGIAIVDDGSEDGSSDRILERLKGTGVDFMLVKNRKRRYAARNFYNVAHLLTAKNTNSVLIELDGDDYLSGTTVLKRLHEEYTRGVKKTCGSFSIFPEIKEGDQAAQELFDKQQAINFSRPWNLTACNSWLPLRSCQLSLLRQVEIDYYLERESKEWLKDRHDAITQSRIIELAGAEHCSFISDKLYVYDLSGMDHDHGSADEYDYNKAHMKLFTDLNKYYRAYSIY